LGTDCASALSDLVVKANTSKVEKYFMLVDSLLCCVCAEDMNNIYENLRGDVSKRCLVLLAAL
jgi:hypothetical protein